MSALPHVFETVRQCAREFAWQYAWTKRENRDNKTLAVARTWLELSLAYYKVMHRKAFR